MGVYTRKESPYYYLRLDGYVDARGYAVREATHVRADATTPTQRRENRLLAEQLWHARMTELARATGGPQPTHPPITFDVFLNWYATHKLPKRRGAERERLILPRLRAAFGAMPLSMIDRHAVEEYTTARLAIPTRITHKDHTRLVTAHASTVNREVDFLKGILQAAVPKYLPTSPLFGMKRLRRVMPKRRTLTPEEETRLLEVLAPDDRALMIVGMDTLLRLGDLLDLKHSDREKDRLWVRDPKDPQQGTPFWVPLSTRALEALNTLPASSSPYLFPRRRAAKVERDRRGSVRQMLETACAKVGIPYGRDRGGITFHWATRRTGASRMIARGVDPKTVQRVGHWATAELVLDIYAEAEDSRAREAVELVGAVPPSVLTKPPKGATSRAKRLGVGRRGRRKKP